MISERLCCCTIEDFRFLRQSVCILLSLSWILIKMPKEKGPEWNYVTVQTNDRPNIQTYALCTFTFSLQTFTIFFRINAFINVYYNCFSRLSHLCHGRWSHGGQGDMSSHILKKICKILPPIHMWTFSLVMCHVTHVAISVWIISPVCILILTDHGNCLMEVFVTTVRISQIGILFMFFPWSPRHFRSTPMVRT